jgi:hypothetical protein
MAESLKYISKMSVYSSLIRSSYIKGTATALLCSNGRSTAVPVHAGYDRTTDSRSVRKTPTSLCNIMGYQKHSCVCTFILG